jgi:predicted SAM-dependent methyltransferase
VFESTEHIEQSNSLLFLIEAHRTLIKGGVLRLSFPELGNVLTKHFYPNNYPGFFKGKVDAYDSWGHIHFYSRESLALVAAHLGFDMDLVECGISNHPELTGINTRSDIVHIHVELTKR